MDPIYVTDFTGVGMRRNWESKKRRRYGCGKGGTLVGYLLLASEPRRVRALLFPIDGVVKDFEVFLDDIG